MQLLEAAGPEVELTSREPAPELGGRLIELGIDESANYNGCPHLSTFELQRRSGALEAGTGGQRIVDQQESCTSNLPDHLVSIIGSVVVIDGRWTRRERGDYPLIPLKQL
jgi:hypothetical protein